MNGSFPIQYHRGLRCFDSCLVYALEEHGMPAPVLYSECLCFAWNQNAALLGERMRFDQRIEALAAELGLWDRGAPTALEALRLGDRRCILHLDAFYCPWHRCFQTEHTDHYCLLIGETAEGFLCVDPMMSSEVQTLTLQQARTAYLNAWTPALAFVSPDTLRAKAAGHVSGHLRRQADALPAWAEHFCAACADAELSSEFAGLEKGSYDVPLYRNLWLLSAGHELTAELLSCLFGRRSDLAVGMLNDLGERWDKYRKTAARDYLLSLKSGKKAALSAPDRELLHAESACLHACLELFAKENAPDDNGDIQVCH